MRKHTVKLNEQRKLNFKYPMTINAKFYFLVDNND
jgi:hypothetical protein